MQFYTSLQADVFKALVSTLSGFGPFNYCAGLAVSCLNIEDQLLMTLMKLRLNYKDLDLAVRFSTGRQTVSNIVNTLYSVLLEIYSKGLLKDMGIPSQLLQAISLNKMENFVVASAPSNALPPSEEC